MRCSSRRPLRKMKVSMHPAANESNEVTHIPAISLPEYAEGKAVFSTHPTSIEFRLLDP